MTSSNCGELNDNAKGCYKKKSTENASMKGKRPMIGSNLQSIIVGEEDDLEQIHVATQDFEPYGPDVGNKEDPPLRPMVYPESESSVKKLMTRGVPTGTRKISFTGDHTGVLVPTNLPYSPINTTWKGKKAVSSGQLQIWLTNNMVGSSLFLLNGIDDTIFWRKAKESESKELEDFGGFGPVVEEPQRQPPWSGDHTIPSAPLFSSDYFQPLPSLPTSLSVYPFYYAHTEQTAVAVVDDDKRLIGKISSSTLAYYDKDVAAAIMNFSSCDLMVYINCGGPPEDLIGLVKMRLQEKKLSLMMELMDEKFPVSSSSSSASSCSSDDEPRLSKNVLGRFSTRRSEAITCYPGSSLVVVLIQPLAHRASSIWVIDKDHNLVGVITFKES
ncbi:hypothetical protein BC332_18612 [Capsicum chinense]|nr:hypothetical protein BC332_18612 [Capsicum chinense]